jgi:hypothetical protein
MTTIATFITISVPIIKKVRQKAIKNAKKPIRNNLCLSTLSPLYRKKFSHTLMINLPKIVPIIAPIVTPNILHHHSINAFT